MQNRPLRIASILSLGVGVLAMAGASPSTRPTERQLLCRVANARGVTASPEFPVVEGQEFTFVAGGEVLVPNNQYVDYGTRISGSVSPSTGATKVLDVTCSQSQLTQATPAVVISGMTARTVRVVRLGQVVHLALGDAAGTTLDLTVR